MDESKTRLLLHKAEKDIDHGRLLSAKRKLLPLVECKNAEAMFLYAIFSINGDETEDEFDKRRLSLLSESSELGYAPAIYGLAVCYYYGDGVEENRELSSSLFQLAAEKGYGKAKLSHAQNLFYGVNGVTKNRQLAYEYVHEAIAENIERATDVLTEFEEQGNG